MDYSTRLSEAIRHFWEVRSSQQSKGVSQGSRDIGNRGAVTGGHHLDGLISVLADILTEAGLPDSSIHTGATTLPGYFRPSKNWDLVVVVNGLLLATLEVKAHVGPSFGNNFNNRVEEALGNSSDLLRAYREGKFAPATKPWMGWLMVLEDAPGSTTPVKAIEPHFEVLPEFKTASYALRYQLFCERLQRENLYDAACLILTDQTGGKLGMYREPNHEVGFVNFATSLRAKALAYADARRQGGID